MQMCCSLQGAVPQPHCGYNATGTQTPWILLNGTKCSQTSLANAKTMYEPYAQKACQLEQGLNTMPDPGSFKIAIAKCEGEDPIRLKLNVCCKKSSVCPQGAVKRLSPTYINIDNVATCQAAYASSTLTCGYDCEKQCSPGTIVRSRVTQCRQHSGGGVTLRFETCCQPSLTCYGTDEDVSAVVVRPPEDCKVVKKHAAKRCGDDCRKKCQMKYDLPDKAHIADVVGVNLKYCQAKTPALTKQEQQYEMCCVKEHMCPAGAQKAQTSYIW